MLSQQDIQDLVNQIVEGYQPEKIYLFGSYANGNPNYDSDIDLFIIKDTDVRKIERSSLVKNTIKKYPSVGLDIIVYTNKEMEFANTMFMNIGKEAVRTGKLLYERI